MWWNHIFHFFIYLHWEFFVMFKIKFGINYHLVSVTSLHKGSITHNINSALQRYNYCNNRLRITSCWRKLSYRSKMCDFWFKINVWNGARLNVCESSSCLLEDKATVIKSDVSKIYRISWIKFLGKNLFGISISTNNISVCGVQDHCRNFEAQHFTVLRAG